jgi:hypothetical protein
MGASYHYGRNGRLNLRWLGWRDEQLSRSPLDITITGRRQPAPERPSLSHWSDKPRRVIPPPDEQPNPHALALSWFNDDGSVRFTATGGGA